jgi:hypothetical protein
MERLGRELGNLTTENHGLNTDEESLSGLLI